jgi:hypothetical protein
MTDGIITALPGQEEPEYSSINEPGRILVTVYGAGETYRWDAEVLAHDGSAFWIQEWIGFDFFFDDVDFPDEGTWVIEDIVGHYTRGDGWSTDDDEDWDWGKIRRATRQEKRTQTLDEPKHCGLPIGVVLYWIGVAAGLLGLVLAIWIGARQ